jgi:hypothetical protein
MAHRDKASEIYWFEPTAHEKWVASPRFRQIGAKALQRFNESREDYEKCRAVAAATGERCGNVAMGNGKCWNHGGGPSREERILSDQATRLLFIEKEKQRTLAKWLETPQPFARAPLALKRVIVAIADEKVRRRSMFGRKKKVRSRVRLALLEGRRQALESLTVGVFA